MKRIVVLISGSGSNLQAIIDNINLGLIQAEVVEVISNNEKYSGCTVHFVNSGLDAGKIILQKKVKITKFETAKSLAKKILIQEHKLYPKAIRKVFSV